MGRWSRGTRENRRAILASSVLMQIAHRAHAALVELVDELNERSSERGPWALTVHPGCNIATVRKCMMMMKHGPRDREFIDAVVERGNELVRPIDLARMMRSGEEWASEDHGVIFYRLVRVLNGARAIAPDETEFGRRDDVARDVQQAMTHAAELGFVVLHEGKAYTDHMHEITIPNGTRFGTVPESKKANKPSFGAKGHQMDMVRKIEINKVKNGTNTEKTKEKVCCPVFVSGGTRFLVKCIGTMRNTETPVQVEGVHLTERLVCKHVTLYHPVSWLRSNEAELLKKCMSEMNEFHRSCDIVFDALKGILTTIRKYSKELEELINDKSGVTQSKVDGAKRSTHLRNVGTQIRDYKTMATEFKKKHEHCSECVRLLSARFHQCAKSYCDEAMKIVDRISNNNIALNGNAKLQRNLGFINEKLDEFVSPGAVKPDEKKMDIQHKIKELQDQCKTEKQSINVEIEAYSTVYRSLWSCSGPDLSMAKVPHDADMCVAVQVSGELFRIVHLTRDGETQSEKKAKKAEEAEEGEIEKYDKAGYKEERNGAKEDELKGDYDDYRECVSAAKKYLEETCIVNDTTNSWSSTGWRLTKPEDPSLKTCATSGSAHVGKLEASDRLELALVPRRLFSHLDIKGTTYDGEAEISKDGIWIYGNDEGGGCEKCCAVCKKKKNEHEEKTIASGLFVRYSIGDDDLIEGLSSRFCFHKPSIK
jgi:hypothetical protein